MRRFSIEVNLANGEDMLRARLGTIPADQVRCARVRGVVDSGTTRLIIPQIVATQLGLKIADFKVHYRGAERPFAQRIHLSCGGRHDAFSGVVDPDIESIMIGDAVLQQLDFVVDEAARRLVPRDPNFIITEVEEVS